MPFNGVKYYPLSVTATSVRNRPSAKCVNMSWGERNSWFDSSQVFLWIHLWETEREIKTRLIKETKKGWTQTQIHCQNVKWKQSQGLSVRLNSSEIHRKMYLISATSNKHGKLWKWIKQHRGKLNAWRGRNVCLWWSVKCLWSVFFFFF